MAAPSECEMNMEPRRRKECSTGKRPLDATCHRQPAGREFMYVFPISRTESVWIEGGCLIFGRRVP